MTAPYRPLLRYHGGKWRLATWIIQHFPPHRVYVEPFGGAGSILLRKERAYAEVYNDLDDDVVNLFRVLRSDRADELVRHIWMTPFSRREFMASYDEPTDDLDKARKLIVRSYMGFGSDGHNGSAPTGFRPTSNRSGTTPAHDWANFPPALQAIVTRLSGVVIEQRHAIAVMAQQDTPNTLHYVDPPYLHETRSTARNSSKRNYCHELSYDDHVELLEFLGTLEGMVIVSGYPHHLYDQALSGWRRAYKKAMADGARPRTECLWINKAAQDALGFGPLL